jgi:hypothetical protein
VIAGGERIGGLALIGADLRQSEPLGDPVRTVLKFASAPISFDRDQSLANDCRKHAAIVAMTA